MIQLKEVPLDFKRTWSYIEDNLRDSSPLSSSLISNLVFNLGHFFLVLPKEEISNEFSLPEAAYEFFGDPIIPMGTLMAKEIATVFIFQRLEKNKNWSCFFDDVLRDLTDPYLTETATFHLECGTRLCYMVNAQNRSKNLIKRCLHLSFMSTWHSLAVISRIFIPKPVDNKMDDLFLQKIVENIEYVIVGAYDGCGYIFWERNPSNSV